VLTRDWDRAEFTVGHSTTTGVRRSYRNLWATLPRQECAVVTETYILQMLSAVLHSGLMSTGAAAAVRGTI